MQAKDKARKEEDSDDDIEKEKEKDKLAFLAAIKGLREKDKKAAWLRTTHDVHAPTQCLYKVEKKKMQPLAFSGVQALKVAWHLQLIVRSESRKKAKKRSSSASPAERKDFAWNTICFQTQPQKRLLRNALSEVTVWRAFIVSEKLAQFTLDSRCMFCWYCELKPRPYLIRLESDKLARICIFLVVHQVPGL